MLRVVSICLHSVGVTRYLTTRWTRLSRELQSTPMDGARWMVTSHSISNPTSHQLSVVLLASDLLGRVGSDGTWQVGERT